MSSNKLCKILDNFKNKKILVIGDIMLDKYIWGEVSRISPEAPVQVVNAIKETYTPGGAANVANNVSALNGNAYMLALAGNDATKDTLISELQKRKINTDGIFIDKNKPTTQKVRIMGRNQQLLRVDYEKSDYVNKEIEEKIISYIAKTIKYVDGVAVSDYAKGVVTKNIMAHLKKLCKENKKNIIVDPKPIHREYYKDVTLITPNSTEASEMANLHFSDDIVKIGKILTKNANSSVLITRGEKGMSLFDLNGMVEHIPTQAKEVYNIIGAGDTVVATIALALVSGANIKEASILANYAAGLKVGKVIETTVSIEEIKNNIMCDT